MRLRIVALTFACLAVATVAEAESMWFGPRVAFPVPARGIGDSQLGIDAGVTLDKMESSHVGAGVDLVYHYWPASARYKAAFDGYLKSTRYEVIDGSTWAFSAFQVTVHGTLLERLSERCGLRGQLGAGMYRVNLNLAEPHWDDNIVIVLQGLSNITLVPGWYASVGCDFRTSSNMVLGLDANYHHLWNQDRLWSGSKDIPDFSAFTVGTHVLFGW